MDTGAENISCAWLGEKAAQVLGHNAAGEVLMCSSQAIYLKFGPALVMLCDLRKGRISFALSFRDFEKHFPKERSMEGAQALCQGNTLSFCGKQIALPGAESRHRSAAAPLNELLAREEKIIRLVAGKSRGFLPLLLPFRRELTAGRLPAGIAELNDPYAKRAAGNMAKLFSALRANRAEEAGATFLNLLGLGPGLTPSTDDWAVGFLYTAAAFAPGPLLADVCAQIGRDAHEYTNEISCAYLENACTGGEFELFEALLHTGESEAAERLLEVGSSSGSDMLCGYLFGLSYCFLLGK